MKVISAPTVVITEAEAGDFADVGALVADAIRDTFFRPGLTADQIAENGKWVAIAHKTCLDAIAHADKAAFAARIEGALAGFVIVDRLDPECPNLDWLMVASRYHGAGVAQALMDAALAWIGPGRPIQLTVIAANSRAIAFYGKYGFADAGPAQRGHAIPRRVMIRPAQLPTDPTSPPHPMPS